ncbi:MAG: hypothetical protein ACPGU4_12600 [Flavobacteriales bacterium]
MKHIIFALCIVVGTAFQSKAQILSNSVIAVIVSNPDILDSVPDEDIDLDFDVSEQLDMLFEKMTLIESILYDNEEVRIFEEGHLLKEDEQIFYIN